MVLPLGKLNSAYSAVSVFLQYYRGFCFRCVNVTANGNKATVLLENPVGRVSFSSEDDAKKFGETLLK